MDREYGAPYYHVHVRVQVQVEPYFPNLFSFTFVQRADLLDMLFKLASPYMTLFLNSRVVSLDPDLGQVTLESGQKFHADVILGADGVKSMIREVVVGGPDKPIRTGDAAYRAIIPASEMYKDPDLKSLIDHPEMTGWIGPGRHIMAYPIVRLG
jgi:salicylate hydroxylase